MKMLTGLVAVLFVINVQGLDVSGPKSKSNDDALSIAQCPDGFAVVKCKTVLGKVHSTCDGVYVASNDISKCVAVNGGTGKGVKAQAVCAENPKVETPCGGGSYIPSFINLHSRGVAPSVSCPKGYTQTICNGRSPWRGWLKGVNVDGTIPNNKPCGVKGCQSNRWCEVTAVCQIKDEKSYQDDVCPTCDNFVCDDDEECVMMDDDFGENRPVCKLIQTGCVEESVCGAGTCIPVGREDYTCECDEGNVFVGVDGKCVPEEISLSGPLSAKKDDATSKVECPPRYVITKCSVTNSKVHTESDGAFVKPEGGNICVAVNGGAGKKGVIAKATCHFQSKVNGAPLFVNVHSRGTNPSVSCPNGYSQILCNAHSPWRGRLNGQVGSNGVIDNSKPCKIVNCTDRYWCEVTAVCEADFHDH